MSSRHTEKGPPAKHKGNSGSYWDFFEAGGLIFIFIFFFQS